jgi:hypothetical protein
MQAAKMILDIVGLVVHIALDLIPLSEPPDVGDIVYHDSDGLVKCRVLWYAKDYELVGLETIEDLGDDEHFRPGHLSLREWQDLFEEIQ